MFSSAAVSSNNNRNSQQVRPPMKPPSSTSSSSRPYSPNVTVGTRPPPGANQSIGVKSCLILPNLGGNKKKKRALRVSSSAASTADQSSTADPFQPNDNNDQQSLLKQANRLSVNGLDWYLESLQEEDGDAYSEQGMSSAYPHSSNGSAAVASPSVAGSSTVAVQPEFVTPNKPRSRQYEGPSSVTPTTTSSTEPSSSSLLLQFPQPQDRSHEERRRQSRSSGHMHAYTGELEPEGVRGQEASVVTAVHGQGSASEIPLRTFGPTPSSGSERSASQRSLPSSPSRPQKPPSGPNQGAGSPKSLLQETQRQRRQQLLDHLQEQERLEMLQQAQQQQQGQQHESSVRSQQQIQEKDVVVSSPRRQQPQEQLDVRPPRGSYSASRSPSGRFESSSSDANHDESWNSVDFEQIVASNVADILQQEQQQQVDRGQKQSQTASGIHRAEEEQVNALTSNSRMTQNSPGPNEVDSYDEFAESPPALRRSAPVNVDDSQFQDPSEHVQGIHAMAMEHVMRGEFDMALQAFSQVLRVYLSEHGRAHPLTASAYHNLGTVHTKRAGLLVEHTHHQRHCREQALLCFQAAARAARDCPQLGPSHPNVAVSLVRIGFLLLQSRQYQNAVITFEEALRIRLVHYGPTHGLVANLYNNLGVCHMHLQNFSVGRRYLQQALDIQKELLNEANYSATALLELADTLCNIGGLNLEWIRQQGPDPRHALDAESSFLEALELRSKVLGENHPLTNQVRSLHDMVRSIPLPEAMTTQVHPHEHSPGTISEMTMRSMADSTVKSMKSTSPYTACRTRQLQSAGPMFPSRSPTENLNLPTLDESLDSGAGLEGNKKTIAGQPRNSMTATRMMSPVGGAERHSKNDATLGSQRAAIGSYGSAEESCLLKRSVDEQSSQGGLVVTYASPAAAESTKEESDREATLRHAKAILEAHRDFLNSPEGPSGREDRGILSDINTSAMSNNDTSALSNNTSASAEIDSPQEDGLVPLAGNWPDATLERISPEVLQNPTQHLHTIQNCAASYLKRGRHPEATHLLEIVVECQKEKNGPLHEDVGDALHNVGIAYLRMEEHYKALSAFEEAVRVRKGALGRDHPLVAVSLVKVGISLLLLQRLEDSLWIFREALTVRKAALGPLHPANARIYNNIGCVHVEFNELKEARKAFEAALDIQRNTLTSDPDNGPTIFGASTTLQNLAFLYSKRDMHEKAAMVLRESLSLQEKVLDLDHPAVLGTLESLGEACLDARRFSHALKYFTQLFDRSEASDALSKLKQAMILHKIAVIYEHQDDPKAQMTKLEMALTFLRSDTSDGMIEEKKAMDRRLQEELRSVREELEKNDNTWV